eukprot:TRINITY_DN64228_c0_g1_i1.p1 TRINITY_DN64228_c0_g1~~TRINITY_DN64228_c0_g1_i1.p1  ORF type:complete len:401 (-),score=111.62 TRINITY_DN64228_c0_g1_i1:119-1321(-)
MPSRIDLGGAAGRTLERLSNWTPGWSKQGKAQPDTLDDPGYKEDIEDRRAGAAVRFSPSAAGAGVAGTAALAGDGSPQDARAMAPSGEPPSAPVLQVREVLWRSAQADGGDMTASDVAFSPWRRAALVLSNDGLELLAKSTSPAPAAAGAGGGSFPESPAGAGTGLAAEAESFGGAVALAIPLRGILDVAEDSRGAGVGFFGGEANGDGQSGKALSERSTFEGSASGGVNGVGCGDAPFTPPPQATVADWLANGLDVGSFDLPPIPLARLPPARMGLPEFKRPESRHNQCSLPVGEFDGSNCKHQSLSLPIPPLPPSTCRLPNRPRCDDLAPLVPGAGVGRLPGADGPVPGHILILWTQPAAGSPPRRSVPVQLSFATQQEATTALEAFATLRASRLRLL